MYDPEAPWMGCDFMQEVVTAVVQPQHQPQAAPKTERTISWKDLKTELKNLIVEYYKKHNEPMRATDVLTHLTRHHNTINVTVDFKLLVILLNNMGGLYRVNSVEL